MVASLLYREQLLNSLLFKERRDILREVFQCGFAFNLIERKGLEAFDVVVLWTPVRGGRSLMPHSTLPLGLSLRLGRLEHGKSS